MLVLLACDMKMAWLLAGLLGADRARKQLLDLKLAGMTTRYEHFMASAGRKNW